MTNLFHATSAALLLATSVQAAAEDHPRQLAVSNGDLDLTKGQGVARLEQRVRTAVRAVCATDDGALKAKLRERSCIKKSSASADQDVALAVSRANQAMARADVGRSIAIRR
jgi:UrcA family protein